MRPMNLYRAFFILGVTMLLIGGAACGKAEEAPPAATERTPAEVTPHPVSAEVVFTKDDPGAYRGKEDSHVPQITYEKTETGLKVRVSVLHEMNAETPHYIMWIKLFDGENNLLGEKEFQAEDERAEAEFDLTATPSVLKAYEGCNLHGVWVNEIEII